MTVIEDVELFGRLAPDPLWCEEALWIRATWLFEEFPSRKFTFEELVPPHLPEETNTRSMLGAALDGQRLTQDAVSRLRQMFPEDRYIQMRTLPP